MKTEIFIATLILLTSLGTSTTITENSGTQTSTTVTLDRPWYTSITIILDENFKGVLQFIPDAWSWLVDLLFIHEEDQENVQVIGKN